MDPSRFFYQVFSERGGSTPVFCGSAFAVAADGGLLTCRHVVLNATEDGAKLLILDNETGSLATPESPPILSDRPYADLAFIPNALGRTKSEYLPILSPRKLLVGEDVYTYGHFAIGGGHANIEVGYFGGKIVNFFQTESAGSAMITLPFAVIEGLSGSPVLTFHNGPKVVGIATGNRISRILAAETMKYADGTKEFHETINRIVEFGTGMHCASIVEFLSSISGARFMVTDETVAMQGL